jgi:hypothetical protein
VSKTELAERGAKETAVRSLFVKDNILESLPKDKTFFTSGIVGVTITTGLLILIVCFFIGTEEVVEARNLSILAGIFKEE